MKTKKFLIFLTLFLMPGGLAIASQTTLMCGGKYIGYDDQFLRKNLKEKMTNYIYENFYRQCVDMKRTEPEIFKAKYK